MLRSNGPCLIIMLRSNGPCLIIMLRPNGSSLYHLLFMFRIAGCLLRMELLYQITVAIAIKAIKDSLFEDSLLRNHTDCMKNTNVVLLIRCYFDNNRSPAIPFRQRKHCFVPRDVMVLLSAGEAKLHRRFFCVLTEQCRRLIIIVNGG